MPSLRDYRDRIKSVKSTKKITSAMKMVAASKLRRAQEQAEASQPYARAMAAMLARVAANVTIGPKTSKLLRGTGSDQKHLLVVVTADRGLCGGFNANLVKEAMRMVDELQDAGKDVSIICVGSKGYDQVKRLHGEMIAQKYTGLVGKTRLEYAEADEVTQYILNAFESGEFDVCTLVYNKFRNVLTQTPGRQQLIPFILPETPVDDNDQVVEAEAGGYTFPYDFEPEEKDILDALLPKNIGVQLFRALLDSSAGEQAARMTAMDNATNNASDMIDDLTLQYNRARQAFITKELIEIISGAEAL